MTANAIRTNTGHGSAASPLKQVLADTYRGFVEISHHGTALVGTALAVAVITLAVRADLRVDAEQQLLGWLLERQDAAEMAAADDANGASADGTSAAEPLVLPAAQVKVAQWLSRKYRVAQEPLSVLVAEAFAIGQQEKLDPTLILAVMAIESRFNPYAQSPVGAQGLMQVLTRVHTDKYEDFGGTTAAFDPVANLRVGVRVLQDCIKAAGSIEGGLRRYVGAVTSDGSGYINKVIAEHLRIQSVALGKPMPKSFPVYTAAPAVEPAPAPVEVSSQTDLVQSQPRPPLDAMPLTTSADTLSRS